ncbi:MAG: ABC transporter ATP-binding protein/permease, partial [Thermoanaerobaculales bacterium]|nr:ABC transporter ATP-binding protein/permease [Thermoanaerobaculales bacterium]
TRFLGAGKFLSWAIESSAVQDLVLDGGFLAFLALIEIVLTMGILALGAGGMAHVAAFALWFCVVLALAWRIFQMKGRQTGARLRLTHDLTERMVGHRTRLAQERPEHWHVGEDEVLNDYLGALSAQDRWASWMEVVGIGWQIVAVTTILPVFFVGEGSEGEMAVAVGGILLGARALATFGRGIGRLGEAMIAWKRIGPIFSAGALTSTETQAEIGGEMVKHRSDRSPVGLPVILARGLSYRRDGRIRPVLDQIGLTVSSGDRVLLEGPSGSGKSTFAALLAALRFPDGGVLLVNGMDHASSGPEAWRDQIALAPQFCENHVFSETFAFNLLMARGWPPTDDDLRQAESLCLELGLGELLEKMPLGIHQMVGDTGWQLSHGERSRLFVARALLQGAEIVVLDESLGPLDPENQSAVMACVERHARTLLVIAHP